MSDTRKAFTAVLRILNKLSDEEARKVLDAAQTLYKVPAKSGES